MERSFLLLLCALVASECCAERRVLVVGDSISYGYTPFLQAELPQGCSVEHIPENAQYSGYTLAHMDEWIGEGERYDAIVYNNGLHDIAHALPDGGIRTSLSDYRENVDEIMRRLLEHTDNLIVCTTTTAIHADQSFRSDADVIAYNAALVAVAARYRCPVVNLYALSACHPEWYAPGEVHPYGHYDGLAPAIAEAVAHRVNGVQVPAVGALGLIVLCMIIVMHVSISPHRQTCKCKC